MIGGWSIQRLFAHLTIVESFGTLVLRHQYCSHQDHRPYGIEQNHSRFLLVATELIRLRTLFISFGFGLRFPYTDYYRLGRRKKAIGERKKI